MLEIREKYFNAIFKTIYITGYLTGHKILVQSDCQYLVQNKLIAVCVLKVGSMINEYQKQPASEIPNIITSLALVLPPIMSSLHEHLLSP